ncbi:MAG: nucleoside monophosphate kinase, partial [Bacilli bacterium]|nr:nucleoside monophosphate kinase [Bacilli bacterium]
LKLDLVINLNVTKDLIIKRLSGRRVCLKCGATYNLNTNPPKKEGICDRCGDTIILRDDDKEETVKMRLDVYENQTKPLIKYYSDQKILVHADGNLNFRDTFKEVVKFIGDLDGKH